MMRSVGKKTATTILKAVSETIADLSPDQLRACTQPQLTYAILCYGSPPTPATPTGDGDVTPPATPRAALPLPMKNNKKNQKKMMMVILPWVLNKIMRGGTVVVGESKPKKLNDVGKNQKK